LLEKMFTEQDARNVVRHVKRMAEAKTYPAQCAVNIILLDLELPGAQGL
jgi:hypothetical protein